jgi:hypothetical protein
MNYSNYNKFNALVDGVMQVTKLIEISDEITGEKKDAIISSIIQHLNINASNESKWCGYDYKSEKDIIKESYKNDGINIFSNHIVIKLDIDDYSKYKSSISDIKSNITRAFLKLTVTKKNIDSITDEEFSKTVTIKSIPKNNDLHKESFTEAYIAHLLKKIDKVVNSDSFSDRMKTLLVSLKEKDYSSTIANARVLVESFSKHILGKKEINNSTDHTDIIKKIYEEIIIVSDRTDDKEKIELIIKSIIDNLSSLLKNLGDLRNIKGASHGVHREYIKLEKHHANLAIGIAVIYIDFISLASKNDPSI